MTQVTDKPAPSDTGPASPAMSRTRRRLLTVFILVHIYCMAFWGLPSSNFRFVMVQPVQDYVLQTGLWHSWDMFSPDPLAVNFHVQAQIRFEDGSVKQWDAPRMEKLGISKRFQKERYRKFRERIRMDVYRPVWDDFARYVARLHATAEDRPAEVMLTRLWETIPPPLAKQTASGFELADYQPMPEAYETLRESFRFHFYTVKPEDLR